MNQHFIIRYKVEDDIPVCPDHILNELKTHVEIIQSKIDAKNLFGKHTLESKFFVPCAIIFLIPGPCSSRLAYDDHAFLIKFISNTRLDHCF